MKKKEQKDVFEMIEDWSKTFSLPIREMESFPEDHRCKLALDLIDEEFMELVQAVDHKDIKEAKDALGDLLWVVVRAMMELGIDPVSTIEAIYISNMSKSDSNEADAKVTKEKYKELGIDTFQKVHNGRTITYNAETQKVLKSHKFQFPNL
jgi:NTP pyrophosphatase (non-canonical NTP hydrolase)